MTGSEDTLTREGLLRQIDSTWADLQAYLTSLTPAQLTGPTDAAGWTAKDHVIHLAMWEQAVLALLERGSKREALDMTPEIWAQDDDAINAVLQQRYQHMPLDDVMNTLRQTHLRLVDKLSALSENDLRLPFHHYQPDSSEDVPLIRVMPGETIHHYREHLTWIRAIVGQG